MCDGMVIFLIVHVFILFYALFQKFYNVYINIPAPCSGIQLCYVERILFFQVLLYDLLDGVRTVLCIELLIIISHY